jgi:formyltetrahydrofolate deformylase
VLTLKSPDRPGIVNRVTGALLEIEGNIVESAQYGEPDGSIFALRTVFDSPVDFARVSSGFEPVAIDLSANITVRPIDLPKRALVMVSKYDHCLLDLLFRQGNGELAIEIPLVISNHTDCRSLVQRYEKPFEHVPVTPDTKAEAETVLLQRVSELEIDFVVLARYMQVLSADVCSALSGRIINIHHSFLPGFKGARPYHQAHSRGVKLIGATAHYVTDDLDEGPIIEQDVARVSHTDSAEDMARIGRDVERVVLSRAVRLHAEDRVVLFGTKTAVFG